MWLRCILICLKVMTATSIEKNVYRSEHSTLYKQIKGETSRGSKSKIKPDGMLLSGTKWAISVYLTFSHEYPRFGGEGGVSHMSSIS